jgi:hypothetical protein
MMLYALAAALAFPAVLAGWIAGELARGTNGGEFNFGAAVPTTLIAYAICWVIAIAWIVATEWNREVAREKRRISK